MLIAVIGTLAVGTADAQTSTLQMPALSSPSAVPESGRVLILVFRDGLPAAGVRVRGEFGEQVSDGDGAIRLKRPEGQTSLELLETGQKTDVSVVGGQETLVSIHLVQAGAAIETRAPDANERSALVPLSEVRGTQLSARFVSESDGHPLAGVAVRVGGYDGDLVSDSGGRLQWELPTGSHVIVAQHPQHLQSVRTIEVGVEPQDMSIAMKPAAGELDEYVVLAPRSKGSVAALVEIRRRGSAVAEVLGSEQMARQGDGDAGASLRRLAGLTLVGGKYVYVRGLGERYSSVQMNGLALPSPEPSRRVVPLDLFPTAVLESVIVQKSSSPDLPGELGGGLIQLRTRSLPEKFFARVSLSTDFSESDGRLGYKGGETDWLAIDDGTRALPGEVRSALASGRKLNENTPSLFDGGYTAEELQALGRSVPNIWNVHRTSEALPPGLSLALGDSWKRKNNQVGVAASLMANSAAGKAERQSGKYNVGAGDLLVQDEEAITEISEVERNLGGTFDVGGSFGEDQRLSYTHLFVRSASDSVKVKEFSSPSDSVSKRRATSLEWVERELNVQQVQGRHRIQGWMEEAPELNWRAGWSKATRQAPDSREYLYLRRTDRFELNLDTTGNRRVYGELLDRSRELGAEVAVSPKSADWEKLTLKAGVAKLTRERRSDVYRLHFKNRFADVSRIDLSQPPETLFAPDRIGPDGFVLTNLTESADSYASDAEIDSGYVGVEYAPSPKWTISSGLRQEISRIEVRTFYYFSPQSPTSMAGLRGRDILPAHALTWKPGERWRARWVYSETLARPDARELSTVPFIDTESGYETVGNSELRSTVIRNIDHRWEFYFTGDEYVSAGVFYKHFDKPVEDVFEPSPNLRKTFENAVSAENRGFEFETRTGLRRWTRDLRRWTVLTNLSLIQSRVRLDPGSLVTNFDRPLQGQSPYVVNVQLQYDRPLWGLSSTLLYNLIGPRISEVGTNKRPDVYEQPFHQLDWVASVRVARNGSLGIKAKNLLDPDLRSVQGGKVVRQERKGRSVGLSLTFAI